VWYLTVLIELFQVEICLSQQHEKSTYFFGGHKIEEQLFEIFTSTQGLQFTNQCVISFTFTNLLVSFFQPPPPGPVAYRAEGE